VLPVNVWTETLGTRISLTLRKRTNPCVKPNSYEGQFSYKSISLSSDSQDSQPGIISNEIGFWISNLYLKDLQLHKFVLCFSGLKIVIICATVNDWTPVLFTSPTWNLGSAVINYVMQATRKVPCWKVCNNIRNFTGRDEYRQTKTPINQLEVEAGAYEIMYNR